MPKRAEEKVVMRNSLEYVGWKDRKALAAELKAIYRAETADKAKAVLQAFTQGSLEQKIPTHRADLATVVGPGHPVFCLSGRGKKGHLYDQRHRELAHAA